MRIFTFNLMEALQRADAALRLERAKRAPDPLRLVWLKRQRRRLAARLTRSSPMLAGA